MSEIIETYNKGAYLSPNGDDLTKITSLCEQSLRRFGGRMAIYENSPEGLRIFMNRACEFFAYLRSANSDIDGKQLVPDIECFCVYMGITRRTLLTYQKNRGEEWNEGVSMVKDAIFAAKKQLASTGRMPPLVFLFDACNNFDYVSTSEFKITTEQPQGEISPQIGTKQITEAIGDCPQLPE